MRKTPVIPHTLLQYWGESVPTTYVVDSMMVVLTKKEEL